MLKPSSSTKALVCCGLSITVYCASSVADTASFYESAITQLETGMVDISQRGHDNSAKWTVQQRMQAYNLPGMAVAMIADGKVAWVRGYGHKRADRASPVDGDTVFSAGSVSKVINATLIMRLVAAGKLDLDKDINQYLTGWQAQSQWLGQKQLVNLRQILSHTAGFNVHGFRDFHPHERLPSLLQILDGQHPAKNRAIRVTNTPGEDMRYSGGGTMVSQLVIEQVTGMDYQAAAKKYVFEPLGMTRSTFANPLPASHGNIAHAHGNAGNLRALPRGWESMPEQAASGLWVSANDLATLVAALIQSYHGDNDFLPQALMQDMMDRESNSWYGLGPRINGTGTSKVFHHGGANDSYRAWIEGHLNTKSGFVVLTNSSSGHMLRLELRRAAERAFDWAVTSDEGFEEPQF